MSKKVIDVSTYNGKIDWEKAKAQGVEGAILKIINKQGEVDKQFEANWQNARLAGVPITGVYNYSYATTVEKAKKDAETVIKVLCGRKTVVWLDVEDDCQKKLGSKLIDIIEAYQKVIEGYGLDFGVYTGLSFYKNLISPYKRLSDVGFWIARYPSSGQHTLKGYTPNAKYQPVIDRILVGWQYSSKLQLGTGGNVDVSDWYYEVDPTCNKAQKKPNVVVANPYEEPTRCLYYKSVLMMHGEDVKWLQHHLVRLGYLEKTNAKGKTNVDGWLGKDTHDAILKAQSTFKIAVDGKVGAVTRTKLKQA